jgi:hypothetical protein
LKKVDLQRRLLSTAEIHGEHEPGGDISVAAYKAEAASAALGQAPLISCIALIPYRLLFAEEVSR